MTDQATPRTFISYSRSNADFALKLARELREAGIPIWLDQLNIPTGVRWDDELERALEECEIFLVILTPDSISSENVKDEIGYAIDTNKKIVPVLLENANLPLRLRRFQYVDFTSLNYDQGVKSAVKILQDLAGISSDPMPDEIPEVQQHQLAEELDTSGAEATEKEENEEIIQRIKNLLNEGKQLAQAGALKEAIEKFQAVSHIDPKHVEALSLLTSTQAQLLKEREDAARKARQLAEKLAARKVAGQQMGPDKSQTTTHVPSTAPQQSTVKNQAESARPVLPTVQTPERKLQSSKERKPVPKGLLIGIGSIGFLVLSATCIVLSVNFIGNRNLASTQESAPISGQKTSPTSTRVPTTIPTATSVPTVVPTSTRTPTSTPAPTPTITGPFILDPAEAQLLSDNGEAKGVGATAVEQWTSEELSEYFDNGETIPVVLSDPYPLIVGWSGTCAVTLELLQEILSNYVFTHFEFNGEVVPESKIVEDYYTSDDGWECYNPYFVIDNWESGEYEIYQEIYNSESYHDGENEVEPSTSWASWLVIVP